MKFSCHGAGAIGFVAGLAACGSTMRADAPSAASSSATTASGSVAFAPVASSGSASAVAPPSAVLSAAAPASVASSTVATPPSTMASSQAQPAGGVLTAASVADADRPDNYRAYVARHPGERAALELDLEGRVRVRVRDAQGRPIANAHVSLTAADGAAIHAQTHADGDFDFYPSLGPIAGVLSGRVVAGNETAAFDAQWSGERDAREVTVTLRHAAARSPRALDLGFAIDVTGSMGDELRYIDREIASIVSRIHDAAPDTVVRVGATLYRDRFDTQPLQQIGFTSDVPEFARRLQAIEASGGGDYPEDMNHGLDAALHAMQWDDAPTTDRVLVLVADAPPQMYRDEQFTYRSAITEAAARGIRILHVAASGADRSVEYLFRAMGAATSTPYVYLTDESGVGAPHLEADTDRVGVERFNNLLVRLVTSDLHGHGMHEPGALGHAS